MTKHELDFIVIGAQKAGTTSLFEYLRRHPELCLPAAKEVPYFSHDSNYARGWDDYLGKSFAFADPARRWGTVTPHYMAGGLYEASPNGNGHAAESDPERIVPGRIRAQLPDVRLIALLRDPVERARSHHAMALMNGWDDRPFDEAISTMLEPDHLAEARLNPQERTGYVVWGEYGRILGGYMDVFPRDRLLVLYTSDLAADPAGTVQRVFEFLGVSPGYVPDNLGTAYRTSAQERRLGWLNLSALQARVARTQVGRRAWHALPERTRRRVDTTFDRLNYLTELWNRRTDVPAAAPAADVEALLRAHYAQDGDRLTALVGNPPPWVANGHGAIG